MFTIKLDDTGFFKKAMAIISDFMTEASFSVKKEGIELVAMDPANICMVILKMLPSAFKDYKAEREDFITLNLDVFQQALKRVRPTDALTLSLDSNRLKLQLAGKSQRHFYIPLLEREEKERKVPDLEFKADIELDAMEFRDYVEDASIAADALAFEAGFESLTLSAGDTGSRVKINIAKNSGAIVKLDVKENVKAIYSIEYLKKMAAASGLSDTVIASFSNDYPLKLDFKALNKLQMDFILAPRIENK